MRFIRGDVRDRIVSSKIDRGPSQWRRKAMQQRGGPKTDFGEIFRVVQFSSFATWGNSGIEPDKGIGNQLSRDRGASLTWPSNDGEVQWNTMLDWTYR